MMDKIFWNFLILYQIFFFPKMKRSVIISPINPQPPPHHPQRSFSLWPLYFKR